MLKLQKKIDQNVLDSVFNKIFEHNQDNVNIQSNSLNFYQRYYIKMINYLLYNFYKILQEHPRLIQELAAVFKRINNIIKNPLEKMMILIN